MVDVRFLGLARLKNEGERLLYENNTRYLDEMILRVVDALAEAKRRKRLNNDDLIPAAVRLLDRLGELKADPP